jgi:hypothetical protein
MREEKEREMESGEKRCKLLGNILKSKPVFG